MVVKRGKEALLLWCKAHTHGYDNVQITDFTTSWHNGLAFCALLHKFYPEMIDFASLKPEEVEKNLTLAFEVGAKVGIPSLLEVREVSEANEASMLAYIAKYYWVFKDRTGSRVKLKRDEKPAAAPLNNSSSQSSAVETPAPASSSSSSSSSSEAVVDAPASAVEKKERNDTTSERVVQRTVSKRLVGHLVAKEDSDYGGAIDQMVKQLQENIIPAAEEQLAGLLENRPVKIHVVWESFSERIGKTEEEKAGKYSHTTRQEWQAVRTLHDQSGKYVFGEFVSVIEQFLSGHPDVSKSEIPERSFSTIRIVNIPVPPEVVKDDEEEKEKEGESEGNSEVVKLLKDLAVKRDTYIKDGEWVVTAPFALKSNKTCPGAYSRNELLVILLDLFGIAPGSGSGSVVVSPPSASSSSSSSKEEGKSPSAANDLSLSAKSPQAVAESQHNLDAKKAMQSKEWRETRSLREMVVKPPATPDQPPPNKLALSTQLNELVWMEISIPAIARQLRVQYPLSTTIGQIKNYLKTQFAEEMQNLYALYAYELCHLRSVTNGGDDVWLLYPDSNLHSYNIQNNDVLEFSLDEEQVQERKPIELEGYLQKEGQKGIMKLWKHRWFSTQDNRLLYFTSETSTDPVGFIPLTQIVSIGSSNNPAHASNKCVFEIKTNLRVYYLMAECEEDKETWVAGMTNSMNYWKSNSLQWTQQWKEGFLVKRGGIRHNWLRRWFMLRDEFLFYYEAKDGSHYLRGKIPLYGVTAEEVERAKKGPEPQFFFNVTTAGRVYQLAAATEEERKGWVKAIQMQGQLFSSKIDGITET